MNFLKNLFDNFFFNFSDYYNGAPHNSPKTKVEQFTELKSDDT